MHWYIPLGSIKLGKWQVCNFWNLNWREVTPEGFYWYVNFSDVFGSIWISELHRMVFVGNFSDILIPGVRAELVWIEIPVISLGDIHSVDIVLFLLGFKVTEVDCVWGWKPVLVFWSDFRAIFFLVIVDGTERISSTVWSTGIPAVIARTILIGKSSSCDWISVLVSSKLKYLERILSVSIKYGSNSCSVEWFAFF